MNRFSSGTGPSRSSSGRSWAEGWTTTPAGATTVSPYRVLPVAPVPLVLFPVANTVTGCPGQDARIHAADLGDAQETVRDAGDHQADAVHVGGNHHGGAWFLAGAVSQSMQRAELAAADFMNEWLPFVCNDFGSRVLVTGKAGGGDQVFEKGQDFCHGGFRSASI